MNRKYGFYLGFFIISGLLGGLSALLKYGTASGIFFSIAAMLMIHKVSWGWCPAGSSIRKRCAIVLLGCCLFYPLVIVMTQGLINGTEILGMDNIKSIKRPFQKTASSISFILVSAKDTIRGNTPKKVAQKEVVAKTAKEEESERCVNWSYGAFLVGFSIAAWKWIRSWSWPCIIGTVLGISSLILTIKIWKNIKDPWSMFLTILTGAICIIVMCYIKKHWRNPVIS